RPDAAMIVATVRGLKANSGKFKIVTGKPLPENLLREDLESLRAGAENLAKMIEIVHSTGLPAVVAINRFPTDTENEIAEVRKFAASASAEGCEISEAFAKGGEGTMALAKAVVKAAERSSAFTLLYESNEPLKKKIE